MNKKDNNGLFGMNNLGNVKLIELQVLIIIYIIVYHFSSIKYVDNS